MCPNCNAQRHTRSSSSNSSCKNVKAQTSGVAEVGSNTSSSENLAQPLFQSLLPWLHSYCKYTGQIKANTGSSFILHPSHYNNSRLLLEESTEVETTWLSYFPLSNMLPPSPLCWSHHMAAGLFGISTRSESKLTHQHNMYVNMIPLCEVESIHLASM